MNQYAYKTLTPVQQLGSGAQASVLLYKTTSNESVAVKKYYSKLSINVDVLRELNALQRLKGCTNIIKLYDVYVDVRSNSGTVIFNLVIPYYVETLTNFIDYVDIDERIRWMQPMLDNMYSAINSCYYNGICHCDIKPDNIMRDEDYNFYLIDFGLSTQLSCDSVKRNAKNQIRGTPLFYAPEMLTNQETYNTKIDVWALGNPFFNNLRYDIVNT